MTNLLSNSMDIRDVSVFVYEYAFVAAGRVNDSAAFILFGSLGGVGIRGSIGLATLTGGWSVEDRYVFGYGMDYKGYLRNAPGIYAVSDEHSR